MEEQYRILEIRPEATDEEVKLAYRAASRKYHPDAHPEDPALAEENFKKVQAAYQEIMRARREEEAADPVPEMSVEKRKEFRLEYLEGDSTFMKAAMNYIEEGYYEEAIRVLNEDAERGGRWQYLYSMASCGAGNHIAAMEAIGRAIKAEPENMLYYQYKMYLEGAGSWYRRRSMQYEDSGLSAGKLVGLFAAASVGFFGCWGVASSAGFCGK